MLALNIIQLQVEGDLSRFMNNTKYSGSVNLTLGGHNSFSDQRNYTCSALVLAQRSGVLENLICCGGQEIPLDKDLFSSGDHRSIADCIKICYGGSVKFTVDNIATIVKFASLYQIEQMFDAAFGWMKEMCTSELIVSWFPLGILIEKELRDSALTSFFQDFICRNIVSVTNKLHDSVLRGQVNLSHIMLEIARATATKGDILMNALECWVKQSTANREFVVHNSTSVRFEIICPDKDRFLKFATLLQGGRDGPDLSVTEIIKEIIARYSTVHQKKTVPNVEAKSVPTKVNPQEIITKSVAQLSIGNKESISRIPLKTNGDTQTNIVYKKSKTALFYPFRQLRDGTITKESILGKFRTNAAHTHGYTEYDYIETCLEWMHAARGNIEQIYDSFLLFNVNYDYVSLVWEHMDKFGQLSNDYLQYKKTCWKGQLGERTICVMSDTYAFSKDDIHNLLDDWALSIEITSDVSNTCERLGCNLKEVGPHVVQIQLKEAPPLMIDQVKVEKSNLMIPGKYHSHPGFVLHCFGLTTTVSGKNEIISLICNTRAEFVAAMNKRSCSQICLICNDGPL